MSTRFPKCRPIGKTSCVMRRSIQGEHEDWDFAYGEFTHTVDNAKKVLYTDPAKRSEVQQIAMTNAVLGSCGNLFPKQYCEV